MKNRISLAILCKNSSNYLKSNIDLFKNFAEIIVVDDYSTDDTKEFCERNGIKYFNKHLNNNFSSQRNFALEKAMSEWVLFLDSDEYIDQRFTDEIYEKVKENKFGGFYIKRKVEFLDHKMTGTEMGNDKVIRLAKKDAGKWIRNVHEYWDVEGEIGTIDTPIVHKTAHDLYTFINKLANYSLTHSKENISAGKRSTILKLIFYPKLKFLCNFIFKKGYGDDIYGFVASILMSFHSFLSWSDSWLENR